MDIFSFCVIMMNGGATNQSPADAIRRYLDHLPQDIPVREELCSYRFWKAVRAEFLAALIVVLFGCGAAWSGRETPSDKDGDSEFGLLLKEIKQALTIGFAISTVIHCFGNISGAHSNPAVSVAMLITRNISPIRTFFYIVAQCLGAIAAAAVFYGLTPVSLRTNNLGVTVIHEHVHVSQAFGVEFLTTFVMVMTVLAINIDTNREDASYKALPIGLTYVLGHFFAYQWTGASMNPVRSLGPAIVMNKWQNHWVYWVGPLLGGIIGAFTHEYTRDSSQTNQYPKRSSRRQFEGREMKRDESALCSQETELTATSLDGRI